MVRSGDDDGVDVVAFRIQHSAEVGVLRRLLVLTVRSRGSVRVNVAKGNNVLTRASTDVLRASAAGPDGGNVQPVVVRFETEGLQRRNAAESSCRDRSGQQRTVEKVSSRNAILSHV